MNTRTLTREQVRRVDQLAVEKLGIPSIVLMENASHNAGRVIDHWLKNEQQTGGQHDTAQPVAILCGGGNNGGDGYGLARHLHNCGHAVELFAAKDPAELKGDAATMASITQTMTLPLTRISSKQELEQHASRLADAQLIVDALLGTGFHGQVREPMASIINAANEAGPPIVALDVPSGLNCQTGEASNATIQAKFTITFAANKVGFTQPAAQRYLGHVIVQDIGAPPDLLDLAVEESQSED